MYWYIENKVYVLVFLVYCGLLNFLIFTSKLFYKRNESLSLFLCATQN